MICLIMKDVAKCSLALEGLVKNVEWPATHKMETDKDVSFEMIGDNVTSTLEQVSRKVLLHGVILTL